MNLYFRDASSKADRANDERVMSLYLPLLVAQQYHVAPSRIFDGWAAIGIVS